MIKVMSFNIRYGLANDGINHWQHRKWLAIARIKQFQPDLLGLQECLDPYQADFIRQNLTNYQFYGVHRSEHDVEMAPILVRHSVFKILDQGCFCLSQTPQIIGSKSWDAVFPRTCTWFKLKQKTTGKVFIFLNTHFDYQPITISKSAQVLTQWIVENAINQPVIITGDFNAKKTSNAYSQLTSLLFDTSLSRNNTFHEFGKINSGWAIDWILASSHFQVIHANRDTYHEGGLYPSDHYPLIARLAWKI